MFSRSSSNRGISFPGFVQVGWVKSAHGIRGEIFLRLNADRADWADKVTFLHLVCFQQKDLKSFEVLGFKPHKNGWLVKLKGIVDRNQSEELAKALVFIDKDFLVAQPGEAIFLDQILGFEVFDSKQIKLGEITGFSSNGIQDLLEVRDSNQKNHLIPFIDEFLVHIDFDKKQLTMDLPPGLLNLEEE